MAAGFGSQLALLAWESMDTPADSDKYHRWLNSICSGIATLEIQGRRLHAIVQPQLEEQTNPTDTDVHIDETLPEPSASVVHSQHINPNHIGTQVLNLLSDKTGYDVDELEPNYELEADLGIDTVKQAEIFSELRIIFNVPENIEFEMTTAPTVQSLIDWFGQYGMTSEASSSPTEQTPPTLPIETLNASDTSTTSTTVLNLLSDKTGYDVDELEPNYELEADLGIDTVKQAEIFSELRIIFNVPENIEFEMTTAPTVQSLIDWFGNHRALPAQSEATHVIEPLTDSNDAIDTFDEQATSTPEDIEVAPRTDGLIPHLFTTRWVPTPLFRNLRLNTPDLESLDNINTIDKLSKVLESKGLSQQADGHIVIDRSKSIEETFQYIKANQGQSIKHWICLLEVPNPDHALTHISLKGARSGLSKALTQEWPHCQSKVIWISPKMNSKRNWEPSFSMNCVVWMPSMRSITIATNDIH